jgi:hypothetical protein
MSCVTVQCIIAERKYKKLDTYFLFFFVFVVHLVCALIHNVLYNFIKNCEVYFCLKFKILITKLIIIKSR